MLWKEIAKLELLSGSTRIALIEPNRFLNREEPNRRGTDTTRTALRFFFTFLKPNEPKRTAGSLTLCLHPFGEPPHEPWIGWSDPGQYPTSVTRGQHDSTSTRNFGNLVASWSSGWFLNESSSFSAHHCLFYLIQLDVASQVLDLLMSSSQILGRRLDIPNVRLFLHGMIPGKWPRDAEIMEISYLDLDIPDTSSYRWCFQLSKHPPILDMAGSRIAHQLFQELQAILQPRHCETCLWADPLQYYPISETRVHSMAHSISRSKSSKKLQQNTLRLGFSFGALIQLDTTAQALVLGVDSDQFSIDDSQSIHFHFSLFTNHQFPLISYSPLYPLTSLNGSRMITSESNAQDTNDDYGPLETLVQWNASQNIKYTYTEKKRYINLMHTHWRVTSTSSLNNSHLDILAWVPKSNIMAKYDHISARGKSENMFIFFLPGLAGEPSKAKSNRVSSLCVYLLPDLPHPKVNLLPSAQSTFALKISRPRDGQ